MTKVLSYGTHKLGEEIELDSLDLQEMVADWKNREPNAIPEHQV